MQRPNASPHGDLNAVAATIPPTPGNTPRMRGSDIAAATAPSTPSVPSAPAQGQNITEWQETSIMYACAAEGPLSGKISLKCTLGQPILARMAYFALFKK